MPLYTYICGTLLGDAPVPRPIRFSCVTQDRCVRNLNWAPVCRGAAVCNQESRCRVLILRVAAFPTWHAISTMLARVSPRSREPISFAPMGLAFSSLYVIFPPNGKRRSDIFAGVFRNGEVSGFIEDRRDVFGGIHWHLLAPSFFPLSPNRSFGKPRPLLLDHSKNVFNGFSKAQTVLG